MILNARPELSTWPHGTRTNRDHAQGREQANPDVFSPLALRWGAQPVALLPGQATQATALSPKRPWDAGKEQGAATHAAAVGYERERGYHRHDANEKSRELYLSS